MKYRRSHRVLPGQETTRNRRQISKTGLRLCMRHEHRWKQVRWLFILHVDSVADIKLVKLDIRPPHLPCILGYTFHLCDQEKVHILTSFFVALKLPFPYSLTFFSPGRNHFQAASKLVFESSWRLFTRFSLETVFGGGSENFLGLLGKFSGPPLKTPSYMDFASYIHPPITEITQGATLADELYSHFYF